MYKQLILLEFMNIATKVICLFIKYHYNFYVTFLDLLYYNKVTYRYKKGKYD